MSWIVSHEIGPILTIDLKDEEDPDEEACHENALANDQLFTFKIEIFLEMFADYVNEQREERDGEEASYGEQGQYEIVVEIVGTTFIIVVVDGALTLKAHNYNQNYDDNCHRIQTDTCTV